MWKFFSNMYSIWVAVDVSDFADFNLVGAWIRKKLFVGHVLKSRGCFVGTSFGWWDLFWVVIDCCRNGLLSWCPMLRLVSW